MEENRPPSAVRRPPLKCLIVDDEAPAHAILQNYIGQVGALQFVASAVNAIEAVNILHSEKIDLIFLDINMPRMTGIEMLESLAHPPKVILTTAYSEFALDGYEHGVVDYLMKPIAFPRFLKAVNKLIGEKPVELSSEILPKTDPEPAPDSIWLKTDKGHFRVAFLEIAYLQSIGNYVRLFLKNGENHLTLMAAKDLEAQLPPAVFARAHKSFVINVNCVTRLSGGQVFLGRTELPIGAIFRKGFLEKISQ